MAGSLKMAAVLTERAAKLRAYLERAAGEGLISRSVSASCWRAWEDAASAVPGLEVPDACPGPDGSLLLTWDRGEQHFELEFQPGEAPMFFYANRETKELWEAPY